MKSIQTTLNGFYSLFQNLNCSVTHYTRFNQTPPFLVWAEHGEDYSFSGDNKKEEQQIRGAIDYFTQTEFDSIVDDIQNILNTAPNVGWSLDSVLYEEETYLIHYSWTWWLNG